MKAIIKRSRLLTTIFLVLGLAVYLAYVIVNKQNGGRTTDDVVGWIIFDAIVFGAIIVGMWVKKAQALVNPALICLVSINLAINSINYLSYYRLIGNDSKPQLNVWLAAINATCCFISLIAFLLAYLIVRETKLFRMIGILMLLEVCIGYLAAGIIDFFDGLSCRWSLGPFHFLDLAWHGLRLTLSRRRERKASCLNFPFIYQRTNWAKEEANSSPDGPFVLEASFTPIGQVESTARQFASLAIDTNSSRPRSWRCPSLFFNGG